MPTVSLNWFYATILVMTLCTLAIATPFLLGWGAAGWN